MRHNSTGLQRYFFGNVSHLDAMYQ
jgi:hypothetical protein